MSVEEELRAIAHLTERLVMRFPQVSAQTVEKLVAATHREYDRARIRTFVPLLVEHDAVVQLRERAGRADRPSPAPREASPTF